MLIYAQKFCSYHLIKVAGVEPNCELRIATPGGATGSCSHPPRPNLQPFLRLYIHIDSPPPPVFRMSVASLILGLQTENRFNFEHVQKN